MCLGVPGKVVSVDGAVAQVDFWGVERQVRLELVDQPVGPGDYVLNHVGYAIRRIPDGEVEETLALYDQLLAAASQMEADDPTATDPMANDPMAADVRDEIAATGGGS